jgi:enediyne biosynthesis protein E7
MVMNRIVQGALRWNWEPRAGRRVAQYQGSGLVRDYLSFRANPLTILEDVVRTCGDVAWFRIAHTEVYLFNEPAAVRSILLEQNDIFERGDGSPSALLPYIGRGVLTTSGEPWRRERRAMNESVKEDMEARLSQASGEVTLRRVAAVTAGSKAPIDVARWAMALTTQISLATFFGYTATDDEAAQFVDDFVESEMAIFKNFIEGIPGGRFIPRWHNLRLSWCMRRVWALAERVVAHAAQDQHHDNILARVLRGSDAAASGCPLHSLLGEKPEDRRTRAVEYVMGFLAAAPENPSNTLAWGLYLLSRHPEVLAKLRAEVDAVLPTKTAPSLDDLGRLKYTRQVIQEIIRLYPGAWCFDREAKREGVVAGHAVPRGALVFISPYLLHRNPRLWDDPDRFVPERFAPGHKPRQKGSYIPFGAGPRQCVGVRYAQLQLHLMLPVLVRDLDFSLVNARAPEPEPLFTLRVRDTLPMRLAARASPT